MTQAAEWCDANGCADAFVADIRSKTTVVHAVGGLMEWARKAVEAPAVPDDSAAVSARMARSAAFMASMKGAR